ncbi:MAG: tRNA pseudouridine(13) synthase TruD [Thiopseudomonas sp.]|nr:tRNA pseudouridine(13) synthase TruD [Thiopseudomonas sp.]
MSESELLGPTAWGAPCGRAVLKASAEDFQVNEVLDIPLSGSGEHLWLWLEKRELNTEEAVRILSKALGVAQRQISYAGLKDRMALTRQWISLHLPGRELDVTAFSHPQLRVLQAVRHSRKLQRGAHSANGFVLQLSRFSGDAAALAQRLQQIAVAGVPNYYGPQRFGHAGQNVLQARHYAQLAQLPERRNLRSRLLSSARSLLFNRILAQRVAAGSWNRAVPGDALSFTQSRSFFMAGDAECDDPRLAELDLHATAALWGAGELPVQGETRALELAVAAGEPDLCRWLEQAGLQQERRILRLPVQALRWSWPQTDCLQLEFVLPTGCFATAVVRELVELTPVEGADLNANPDCQ